MIITKWTVIAMLGGCLVGKLAHDWIGGPEGFAIGLVAAFGAGMVLGEIERRVEGE